MQNRMTFLCGSIIIMLSLAGCIGGPDDPPLPPEDGTDDDPLANETEDVTALPTLGPPIDPWAEDETERLLFEGTVDAAPCPMSAPWELVYGQYVQAGCAGFDLPAGTLIPLGTKTIIWEADASNAQVAGKWYAYLYTAATGWPEADQEPTRDKAHTWEIELVPGDWDLPDATESASWLGYWTAYDPVNALVGPVETKLTAVRDPDWTPKAPLDHWRLPEIHEMPQEGVITVFNDTVPWSQPAGGFGTWPEMPRFTDRVPLGTTSVLVGLTWDEITGCAALDCRVWTHGVKGGIFLNGFGDAPVERATNHLILRWEVPDPFPPEPDHVEANQTQLALFITTMCPVVERSCNYPPVPVETDVRILTEAWRDDVDLNAFKERLGVV